MKSADEIILQKEWEQLSPGEKDMIVDIAATEKEYNLVRKILQVSADETKEVPALDAGLSLRIQQSIQGKKQTNKQWYGWLAAACVVGLILAIMVLNKNERPESFVKEKVEIKKPVIKNDTIQQAGNDSMLVNKTVEEKIESPKQALPTPLQTPILNHAGMDDIAFANVTVAEEAGLLELISEAE